MTPMQSVVENSPKASAELVTKSIRSKLNPIETQLQNARDLLDGTINVFLPKKQEFILDWLLERLKGEKTNQHSDHVQAELWRLLNDLWKDDGLDAISRVSCFVRHNFSAILQRTLDDLILRSAEERVEIITQIDGALQEILHHDSEVKIRPPIDQTIQLYGLCLSLITELPSHEEELGARFFSKFSQIFRTILYDGRPTKKVAKAFAHNCLLPSLIFLTIGSKNARACKAVEDNMQDSLFSIQNLVDYINVLEAPQALSTDDIGFENIVKAISSDIKLSFDDTVALPSLLKVALKGLSQTSSKITSDQKSLLGSIFLSSLDAFSVPSPSASPDSASSVIIVSNHYLAKLCGLLQVFHDSIPPASDALSSTLTSIATTCVSFLDFTETSVTTLAWNALALLMEVDFDVVLNLMDQLNPKLYHATFEFLRVVVMTNFKLRQGTEFLKHWSELLKKKDAKGSPLLHLELVTLISEEIQKSLSSSQILELLHFFHESLEEESITTPLKAVLLGVKSHEEVIDHVSPYISKQLGPSLHKKLRKKDASEDLFEIYFLTLELSDTLTVELYNSSVVKRATKLCQMSLALFPLQCVFRLKEICGSMQNADKKISRAFRKSLRATLKRLKEKTVVDNDERPLRIIDVLVSRWILLIKYLLGVTQLTTSDASSERLREDFIQTVCGLGSTYDYSRPHVDNTATSIRYVGLQYQFLMSSDVYERVGLADPLMKLLKQDLTIVRSAQVNGDININHDKIDKKSKKTKRKWMRCQNAVMIVSRMPLDSISLRGKNGIFRKLLLLDRAISRDKNMPLRRSSKVKHLMIIRHTLLRYVIPIIKIMNEEIGIIDGLFDLYKSIDKFSSEEFRSITMILGETSLRRFAQSSSSHVPDVLIRLINSIFIKASHKFQNLRASLQAWLEDSKMSLFIPDGETLLCLTVLEEIVCVKEKLDSTTQGILDQMRLSAMEQLRDCLIELIGTDNTVENGLPQATYLLETFRRLLTDKIDKMDLKGLLSCLRYAFSVGIKKLNSQQSPEQELTVRSLKEIFEIMCILDDFESSIILCAAYISLLASARKLGQNQRINNCFAGLISQMDSSNFGLILQEMAMTAITNTAAVEALIIALDAAPEGQDIPFVIAKLLFKVTRNMLATSSADVFVGYLKIIVKILREKSKSISRWNLDHLLANLTIACSPVCPQLEGSATQDEIFESIGSVVLTILQLYHRRLTTKYHLIVRMLQVMLHVFVTTTSVAPRKLRETVSRPPPWLTTSCSTTSAQLFSRILTMWASPPSVTWYAPHSQEAKRRLTSNAAKTGRAVSKHIPWFMMEYVALQAEYPDLVMEESVQKALAPGLYALFNVLGTHEREMCMGALDNTGRGIFKKLWEDWNKFGRFVEK